MRDAANHKSFRSLKFRSSTAAAALLCGLELTSSARTDDEDVGFGPGHLLLSRVVYDNNPNTVVVNMVLPPGCVPNAANKITCTKAIADGTYPQVWNNDTVDGSFGITAKIVLDELTRSGHLIGSLEVPN